MTSLPVIPHAFGFAAISVRAGARPQGSAGGLFDGDVLSWMIIGVVALVLGVVLVAFYQHWSAGRRFKKLRKGADLAAKDRPRRFTGDAGRRR